MFSRFDTVLGRVRVGQTDSRTDGRTDRQTKRHVA